MACMEFWCIPTVWKATLRCWTTVCWQICNYITRCFFIQFPYPFWGKKQQDGLQKMIFVIEEKECVQLFLKIRKWYWRLKVEGGFSKQCKGMMLLYLMCLFFVTSWSAIPRLDSTIRSWSNSLKSTQNFSTPKICPLQMLW